MADIKNDSTIRIYRDGKPEDVPVNVFDQMEVHLVSNFCEIYDVLFR